jgi:hypothetical protein
VLKCIPLSCSNGPPFRYRAASISDLSACKVLELSIAVNFARCTKCLFFLAASNAVRILTICCLIASVHVCGCASTLLQRQSESPVENKIDRKSELVKPKIAGVPENGAAGTRNENPKNSGSEEPSLQNASENTSAGSEKQNQPSQIKPERPKPEHTKSNTDSSPEKSEASDPARRITAKAETSPIASETDDAGEAKSKEPFKRHDHSKYLETIKNKAVDLVNSDKESDYAAICKDLITDQWSLSFYYTQEKTYKFVTYVWDEIDDKWQKSFVSDKRPISTMEKHLKYSSSGRDCKVLKKMRR